MFGEFGFPPKPVVRPPFYLPVSGFATTISRESNNDRTNANPSSQTWGSPAPLTPKRANYPPRTRLLGGFPHSPIFIRCCLPPCFVVRFFCLLPYTINQSRRTIPFVPMASTLNTWPTYSWVKADGSSVVADFFVWAFVPGRRFSLFRAPGSCATSGCLFYYLPVRGKEPFLKDDQSPPPFGGVVSFLEGPFLGRF